MKNLIRRITRIPFEDQSGWMMPMAALTMVGLFGAAGISLDAGRAYVVQAQLQSYANAAALAASGDVYNTSGSGNTTAIQAAEQYSATSSVSGLNMNGGVGGVTTTIQPMCVDALMGVGNSCPSTGATANAVKVTESATVNTTFMRLFGFRTLTVSSSAVASMVGVPQTWNVAVVLDATSSMGSAPPSGSCSGFSTEFACEMNGVQKLLGNLNACAGVTGCTSTTAKIRVSLFSFPNVSVSSVADDWNCSGSPTNEPYTFPDPTASSYSSLKYSGTGASPTVATTYQDSPNSTANPTMDGDANGFVYNYWSSSTSNRLIANSSINKSVTGCMKNPGGETTYYAGVIYAAQAALQSEQAAEAAAGISTNNAMIILTDGEANVTDTSKLAKGTAPTGGKSLIGSPSKTNYYPSTVDQCQQAIAAAQAANAAGTTVYAVAFNSASSGCTGSGGSDTSIWATATSGQPALTLSNLKPCSVMKNMASPPSDGKSYFYADTSASSSGCADSAHTIDDVASIFFAISYDFLSPGLLPKTASGKTVGSATTVN